MVYEHVFVTSQGSAYGRLRRALDTGNRTIALAAAAELDFVSLPDASSSSCFWAMTRRSSAERRSAGTPGTAPTFRTSGSRKLMRCLRASPASGRRPKASASALAEHVNRRGLERRARR